MVIETQKVSILLHEIQYGADIINEAIFKIMISIGFTEEQIELLDSDLFEFFSTRSIEEATSKLPTMLGVWRLKLIEFYKRKEQLKEILLRDSQTQQPHVK